MTNAFFATALYACFHSLLATDAMKETVARVIGERRRNAFYRPAFNLIAVASLAGLVGYLLSLPDRRLYAVRGRPAVLMRAGQVSGLAFLIWTTFSLDVAGFIGLRGMWAFVAGDKNIPAEQPGQGPAIDRTGDVRAVGPFAHTRQPANFAFVPLLGLNPVMTTKWAAVAVVAVVYSFLGSLHSEQLLRQAYGPAYTRYRQKGVPFFIPTWRPRS